MLKYPCLVLDHDDTVVQSEATINYPFFCTILESWRPGTKISLQEYTRGCYELGFARMCQQWYGFTDRECRQEYRLWQDYIRFHIPLPYGGIDRVIRRQKEAGGLIFVVSHSCRENITRDYDVHFGIRPDEIYGWDLPEALRKPSPYALQQIMAEYSVAPEQMLVVDDMKPAWDMARQVGAPVAFAAWSRSGCPELAEEMTGLCDFSFQTPAELEKFLFG